MEEFPTVTKDSNKFAKEYGITIQAYQPGFSDLHQLINMLVGEVQARHWMRIAGWEHPESNLEKQTSDYWEEARELARKLYPAIPEAYPKDVNGAKFRIAHRSLTNLLLTIMKDSRSFLGTIQVLFWVLATHAQFLILCL